MILDHFVSEASYVCKRLETPPSVEKDILRKVEHYLLLRAFRIFFSLGKFLEPVCISMPI